MQPPRQTTDRMLRDSLQRPSNLRDFLADARPELVGGFDFDHVRPLPREFFTADWHGREADLIFEIPYQEAGQTTQALVGVLIEHQSDTDTAVPLRAFFLLAGFWERHWRQWAARPTPRGPLQLPPVLPIVLYTADLPWGSNTNIRDLLAAPATFHPFAPDWGPVFFDLAGRTPEQLLAGGPWMQLMAVIRMTAAERDEFERVFVEAVRHLQAVQGNEPVRWSELLHMILTFAFWKRPAEEWNTLTQIAQRENPARIEEVRIMVRTAADVEMERGEIRGAKATLRRQLKVRFGDLPETLLQQIDAINDIERLNAALDQVVQVKSLDEFKL